MVGILSGHIHHDRFSVWHGIPVIVGMGQHAATDILTTDVLRMVEGASFGIGTIRRSGLTMALVPLPQTRAELNRYDLKLLRQSRKLPSPTPPQADLPTPRTPPMIKRNFIKLLAAASLGFTALFRHGLRPNG
ncbi:hypothetical protein [Devosia ginsengisoli]|uniref:hypothetical protein n=1 Tax=Devosia ginsengisoli TaxID=400770 RepID=UPI0026EAE315|nr:hypothetical protein [Devosia ginsengisoli]MCR6673991.1 hypothetical protein [Devosia ginsengisoli]